MDACGLERLEKSDASAELKHLVSDDGGLLDLNTATPAQLSSVCGLPPAVAHEVVTARHIYSATLVDNAP